MARCLVSLFEPTVDLAFSLRTGPEEHLASVIARALTLLASERPVTPARLTAPEPPPLSGEPRTEEAHSVKLFGRHVLLHKKQDVLACVLIELSLRNSEFLARLGTERGRTRRYVAKSREALYPGSPHLAKYARDLGDGWWMATNFSERDIDRAIRKACEVAGVVYGADVSIKFGSATAV